MNETNEPSGEISIRSYRLVRDYLGKKQIKQNIPGNGTVGELVADIAEEHDADPDDFVVIVNGKNIKQLDGLETSLQHGDELTLSLGSVPE